jgi:serine/threonine-protein kinase RsbT
MTGNGSNQKRVDLLIRDAIEVIQARREGLEMAKEMGFSLPRRPRLPSTLIAYTGDDRRFEITARDRGPGIADVDRALSGGYSTSGGLGKGLSGSKRLMDTFQVDSRLGFGTTVKASKRLR